MHLHFTIKVSLLDQLSKFHALRRPENTIGEMVANHILMIQSVLPIFRMPYEPRTTSHTKLILSLSMNKSRTVLSEACSTLILINVYQYRSTKLNLGLRLFAAFVPVPCPMVLFQWKRILHWQSQ